MTQTPNYTAKDIRILAPEEAVSRFEWAHIGALAAKHHRPAEWIERGFRACQHVGVPVDYFVERYLEGKPVARREDVDAAFRELFAKGRA